jgi:hypothetical protein
LVLCGNAHTLAQYVSLAEDSERRRVPIAKCIFPSQGLSQGGSFSGQGNPNMTEEEKEIVSKDSDQVVST